MKDKQSAGEKAVKAEKYHYKERYLTRVNTKSNLFENRSVKDLDESLNNLLNECNRELKLEIYPTDRYYLRGVKKTVLWVKGELKKHEGLSAKRISEQVNISLRRKLLKDNKLKEPLGDKYESN